MFERKFFILSPSFHGATLLAKLLNAHPQVTALGDTLPSSAFDQVCGCGKRVSVCPFWQAVRSETGAAHHDGRTRNLLAIYPGETGGGIGRLAYSDFISFWATPAALRRWHREDALAGFRAEFESFLDSVHRHTRAAGPVFVDGVKYVSRVEALAAAGESIDGIIHLYRDPVDFVASSIRNIGRGGWVSIVKHALRYRLYHTRARQAGRHAKATLVLNYEGVVGDSDNELARLFDFLGVAPMTMAQLRPYFSSKWHFMGNASLFNFDGKVRPSRHAMSHVRRSLIRLLAGT